MEDRISRKDFFREALRFFREQIPDLSGPKQSGSPRYVLPPGVETPDLFLEKCNQCYDCVGKCPHYALQVCREAGHYAEGYPVIEPRRQPCYWCSDFPCIQACTTGALQTAFQNRPLGTAVIDREGCLAYQGNFCQACINNCPLAGTAIQFDKQLRPIVTADECTGCGICTYTCPTENPAITIELNRG